MILFNLDINHICVSGGSACTSGAQQGSHVIRTIYPGSDRSTVRFSFSRNNTRKEVDEVVNKLKTLV
jgi:cysteine desulfurase